MSSEGSNKVNQSPTAPGQHRIAPGSSPTGFHLLCSWFPRPALPEGTFFHQAVVTQAFWVCEPAQRSAQWAYHPRLLSLEWVG